MHLKADVKVSVLSGEGEGARVSVNTPWVLFHPGVKLLGLQGGESWVLALSTAPCDGCSTCALVLAEVRRSRRPTLRELAPPQECHQHLGSQAGHPMPRLGAPSATVLTARLIYHCTLVKVETCHLPYHLHGPAWGRARKVPLLNRSLSPAESECLSDCPCLRQSLSCGRKTDQ